MSAPPSPSVSRPLICLAGSGGGHVRQILDLKPVWQDHARFFVTEDTALGRSIAADEPTDFVPHFALGQSRLGHPFKMLRAAWDSIWTSLRIVRRRRPDNVITTGAGSMLFVTLFARLSGARIILVDSFARFDAPSAFARLAGPLAHRRVAQSARSAEVWGTDLVFDPLRTLPPPTGTKEPLIFATVGATLAFPRLVTLMRGAIDAGAVPERAIIQTGEGEPAVPGVESHETIPFGEVQALLDRAAIVVCHGGTGSIITALRAGCRVVAIPREFERGEHYDNHQSEIVDAFVARGLIETVVDDDLVAALERARARPVTAATTDPAALIDFLRDEVAAWRAR